MSPTKLKELEEKIDRVFDEEISTTVRLDEKGHVQEVVIYGLDRARRRIAQLFTQYHTQELERAKIEARKDVKRIVEQVNTWLPGFSARAQTITEQANDIMAYKHSLIDMLESLTPPQSPVKKEPKS